MRIIGIAGTTVLVLAGFLAWNAEATTLTGSTATHPGGHYSLVEKVGCWLPGQCDMANAKSVTDMAIASALLALAGIPGGSISAPVPIFGLRPPLLGGLNWPRRSLDEG